MRIVLGALVILAVAWLIGEADSEAPPPPRPPPKAVVEARIHDCRDLCEQTAIVEKLNDNFLEACRARCSGTTAPREREPISRITVAPADHHSTIATEPPPRLRSTK